MGEQPNAVGAVSHRTNAERFAALEKQDLLQAEVIAKLRGRVEQLEPKAKDVLILGRAEKPPPAPNEVDPWNAPGPDGFSANQLLAALDKPNTYGGVERLELPNTKMQDGVDPPSLRQNPKNSAELAVEMADAVAAQSILFLDERWQNHVAAYRAAKARDAAAKGGE